jgi:hypothetical protein
MKARILAVFLAAVILGTLCSCKSNTEPDAEATEAIDYYWQQSETELPLDPAKIQYPKLVGDVLYYFHV